MSTTLTTNIGLIKPDTDESIKEDLPTFDGWATQNAANCEVIDGLFRNEYDTWTPAWTASVNPTLGAGGFVEGNFVRLFPRMVIGFLRVYTGGAGFATGTGTYLFSVPATMDADLDSFINEVPVGKAVFRDDSTVATTSAFTVMYSTVSNVLFLRAPAGDSWSSTNPVVPAQQDRLSAYFMYPTSDA